MATENVQV